jgi:hypothetical protein
MQKLKLTNSLNMLINWLSFLILVILTTANYIFYPSLLSYSFEFSSSLSFLLFIEVCCDLSNCTLPDERYEEWEINPYLAALIKENRLTLNVNQFFWFVPDIRRITFVENET